MKEGQPKKGTKSLAVGWRRVRLPGGGYCYQREVDPKIQAQMPTKTSTFTETTGLDLLRTDLRNLLYEIELFIKGGETNTAPPEHF